MTYWPRPSAVSSCSASHWYWASSTDPSEQNREPHSSVTVSRTTNRSPGTGEKA
jgi:hypothetical protein